MEQIQEGLFADETVKEQVLKAAAIPCLNCGETLTGKFCNECGQWSGTSRLSLREILVNLWHSLTETDIGILHLIKELAYRPGHVMREYAAGKRKKYFNPWSFYILTTALFVYAAGSSGIFSTAGSEIIKTKPGEGLEEAKGMFSFLINILENHLKMLNFLSIPFVALCSCLLYRKSGYNYAENLVFQALIHGQIALAFFVLIGPSILFPKSLELLNVVYSVVSIGYLVMASRQFFQDKWWKTTLKTLLINAVNSILIFGVAALYWLIFLKEAV